MKTIAANKSIRLILGPLIWACWLGLLFFAGSARAQCDNGICRPGTCPPGTCSPGTCSPGTCSPGICSPRICPPGDYPPGDCSPGTTPQAVVRVMNAARGGRYYGTGTLVDSDEQGGVVLTCAHLFPQQAGNVVVTFSDGRRVAAQVRAVDSAWDLAALEIPRVEVKPVEIAAEHPQPGEPLSSCGYGSDGRYWCNHGRALGYVRTAAGNSYETLELSGRARQGDSGGPVFNQRGELVAVLWGTDGRTVGGTYCGRIRKFLARLFPHRHAQRPQPSPDGASPPVRLPAPPRSQDDGEGGLHKRLDELTANFKELHRQLNGQEQSLGQRVQQALEMGVSLRGRLEKTESAVGNDSLRAVVREVAGNVLVENAPGLAAKVLPAVLTAMGWTGPPSMALIVAAKVLAAIWKRHRKQNASAASRKKGSSGASRPLSGGLADQLAGMFSLAGRSSLGDATLGREYDEELRSAAESGDPTLARWARNVRDRVAQKFYRIHSQSPAPAEPLSSAKGAA